MDSLFSIAKVNASIKMEKAHAEGAEAEAERLSSQVNELQENMAESLAEKLKLEHQIYDVDIHTASTRTTGTSEAELVIRHLKEELSQSEAKLRDARKVKQKHVNAELLKERLESEKARAERAEAELSNLANLESKVKELEIELSSWKEMIATLPGVETCNDMRVKFAELQRFEITMLLIVYLAYGADNSGITCILLSFTSWFLALSWLFAPYIFNPYGFEWQKTFASDSALIQHAVAKHKSEDSDARWKVR